MELAAETSSANTPPAEAEATTPTPAHVGILRDEILVLRWVFGYCDVTAVSGPAISGLSAGKLRKSQIRDVRFIAVDIDALQENNGVIQQFHIGISALDTRTLRRLATIWPDATSTTDAIESHHLVIGNAKFSRSKSNKFLFGQFETLSMPDFRAKLETLTIHRNVVLVVHGGRRELDIFQRLELDLDQIYFMDTVKAAQSPLRLSYRYSLERLLEELGIPFANLHCAGNDAHFVLRALLMIAVVDVEQQVGTAFLPEWSFAAKQIAQAPRPFTKAEIEQQSTHAGSVAPKGPRVI